MSAWGRVLGVMVLCAACGSPPQSPSRTPEGTLRVALASEPRSLNPAADGDELAYPIASNIYNRLVGLTLDGRVYPDLAESWSLDEAQTTYTFRLRRGVRWHDGIPFTAHDVKWTIDAFRGTHAPVGQLVERIAEAVVVDDHTLGLRLKEPWAPFVVTLGEFDAIVLPRHRYTSGDWKAAAENSAPVGTGPFRFAEWRRGHGIRLEANREYFREGPFVASVEFRFVPDVRRAAVMVTQGEVDLIIGRPAPEDLQTLADAPRVTVTRTPSDARFYAVFNHNRRPFSDPRARLGANLAVNRRALVARALAGIGAPAFGFFTPQFPWAYNEQAQVPARDSVRAARLLRESGATTGRRPVIIATARTSTFTLLADEVARQLAALGVPAKVRTIPPARLVATLYDPATEWDMALLGGGNGPDPDVLRLRLASNGLLRFSGYSSRRFDEAVSDGGRRSDMPGRAAAYKRAQQVLAEDLPIMPLAEGVRVTVCGRRVRGLPQTDARGLVGDFDYSLVRVER